MKRCIRCGHEPCPHCKDWCDVVLQAPGDPGCHDPDEDYPQLCCDGECVLVDVDALEAAS